MADDRLQLHIADWMRQLALPATVELRCRQEVIDSVNVADDSELTALATDLLESATTDAQDEGKTRVYELVGIDARNERYICPLRIRRRIDKTAGDILAALAKQNAELHAHLVRKDKEAADLLLKFAQALGEDRKRLVDENTDHRKRATEVIDKLESLRSQALERDLVIEKHKSDIEVRERLTDAVIPLGMAIAGKLTGGAVKGDLPASTLTELVKSLNETQLDSMQPILGDDWPVFNELFSRALDGHADVQAFRARVDKLAEGKKMGVFATLNMGQRAALEVLLNGDN